METHPLNWESNLNFTIMKPLTSLRKLDHKQKHGVKSFCIEAPPTLGLFSIPSPRLKAGSTNIILFFGHVENFQKKKFPQ
jgi:hypothetical protein